MNILIVEDEHFSAQHLREMLQQLLPDSHISGPLDSISAITHWFANHPSPELAFFDIQLADGLSFEAFKKAEITCPVIFTTAFDEYAIRAFKLNSVDYLLKPINRQELKAAIEKYRRIFAGAGQPIAAHKLVEQVLSSMNKQYKSRFSIRLGERLIRLRAEEVDYFYTAQKSTFLCSAQGRNYDLDYSLDQLEKVLDPEAFFRISRKFIIRMDAIKDILMYSGSRLKIEPNNPFDEEMIVSREKVKDFRKWLEG